MIIPINDNYQITSDSVQWRIENRGKKKDKEDKTKDSDEWQDWSPIGFYANFEQASAALGDRMIRESPAVGVAECIKEVKAIAAGLRLALSKEKVA